MEQRCSAWLDISDLISVCDTLRITNVSKIPEARTLPFFIVCQSAQPETICPL